MKILVTTDWYEPTINGVVTSVNNLVRGLRQMGHDVRVLTLSDSLRPTLREGVYAVGSLSIGKVYPGARLEYSYPAGLMKKIIAWKPDIVHSQCEFGTFPLARHIANACSAPLVHTYHTVYEDYAHYFCPSNRLGRILAADFSKNILKRTDAVIAPTDKVRDMLIDYGVRQTIHTIPSGLDLGKFTDADADEEARLRSRLNIDETMRVLVYVGRLAREKHVNELLELLKRIDDPNVRLLLVGDGPEHAALLKQVEALGLEKRVLFTGMVPPADIPRYYALGNIFVTASRSETQGLTYIEAMACGLPVLCRRDPCLEQVVENGVNGFQYENADEFLAYARRLIEDECYAREIGKRAAEAVHRRYSTERFAGDVLKVYARLLNAHANEALPSDRSPRIYQLLRRPFM